jgi:hypothetical protein
MGNDDGFAAYRDPVCVLLGCVAQQTGKAPASLRFVDVRNARLSTIQALYGFAIFATRSTLS